MPLPLPTISLLDREVQLRMLVKAYMKADNSDESFDFYYSTENNQAKYLKYIRPGAPREVNLHSTTRRELTELARRGVWDQMTPLMERAKGEVEFTINRDILVRFRNAPEYSRWWVMKNKRLTEKGEKAFNLLKRDLGIGKKEAELKALMLVVEGGRTPDDRKTAFVKVNKMMKLNVKAATHFRAAGLAVP